MILHVMKHIEVFVYFALLLTALRNPSLIWMRRVHLTQAITEYTNRSSSSTNNGTNMSSPYFPCCFREEPSNTSTLSSTDDRIIGSHLFNHWLYPAAHWVCPWTPCFTINLL